MKEITSEGILSEARRNLFILHLNLFNIHWLIIYSCCFDVVDVVVVVVVVIVVVVECCSCCCC